MTSINDPTPTVWTDSYTSWLLACNIRWMSLLTTALIRLCLISQTSSPLIYQRILQRPSFGLLRRETQMDDYRIAFGTIFRCTMTSRSYQISTTPLEIDDLKFSMMLNCSTSVCNDVWLRDIRPNVVELHLRSPKCRQPTAHMYAMTWSYHPQVACGSAVFWN